METDDISFDVMTCKHDGTDQRFEARGLRFESAISWAAGHNSKPSSRVAVVVPMGADDTGENEVAEVAESIRREPENSGVSIDQTWNLRVQLDLTEDFKANQEPLPITEILELIEEIDRPVRFIVEPAEFEPSREENMASYAAVLCSQLTEQERYSWFDDAKSAIEMRGKTLTEVLEETA